MTTMAKCGEILTVGDQAVECMMVDMDPDEPGTMHMLHQALIEADAPSAFVAWRNLKHPHWKGVAA